MSLRKITGFYSTRSIRSFALGLAVFASGNSFSAPMDEPTVLKSILQRSKNELALGNKPIIIFDLDDTIFDAGSRTLAVLIDMARDPMFKNELPQLEEQLKKLTNDDIHYELTDNLDMLGIMDARIRERVTKYWSEKFFKSCDIDAIHKPAQKFVLQAYKQGVQIVYLTGRDQPNMMTCTVKSLSDNKLPLGTSATLMLKPNKNISDVTFKQQAFKEIEAQGTVVAGFDNEPANVNAMADYFYNAEIVFVDTRHSNRPDVPYSSIATLKWK